MDRRVAKKDAFYSMEIKVVNMWFKIMNKIGTQKYKE